MSVQAMENPTCDAHISYNIVMHLKSLYDISVPKQKREISRLVGQQACNANNYTDEFFWDGRISETLVHGMANDVLFDLKPLRQIPRNVLGKILMEIDWDNLPPNGAFQVVQHDDKRFQHFSRALYMFLQFSYVTVGEHGVEMMYRGQKTSSYHDNMSGIRYYHFEDNKDLLDALWREEGKGYIAIAKEAIDTMTPVASVNTVPYTYTYE